MNTFFKSKILFATLCFLAATNSSPLFSDETLVKNHSISQPIGKFETEKKIDQLLLLIQKRLVIMHQVARTKWNQNLPIEDKAREQQLLVGLIEEASHCDLNKKWIAKFFQVQFHAAKEIQRNDFNLWREKGMGKFENILSLKDELRSSIDEINQEMINLLSQLYGKGQQKINYQLILESPISTRPSDYIDPSIWLLAISPFKN